MVAATPLFVPLDGRIPSQNLLVGPLDGTEVFETVWPGNNAQGNTYQVTAETIAQFVLTGSSVTRQIITSGATAPNPYLVLTTDAQVLFNKTVGTPSYAMLPLAASMASPIGVVFKDLKGDAATNNITIFFTGGELCDGQSTVVISNAYGKVTVSPIPLGGGWFLS